MSAVEGLRMTGRNGEGRKGRWIRAPRHFAKTSSTEVIFTFSGMLGMHRSFGVEQPDRGIDGLLASPVARESIFLGKALANLIFVAAVQAIAIPAVGLFYGLPLGDVA